MLEWSDIHAYKKLVRTAKAPAICCEFCDNEYVTLIGDKDTVVLGCIHCNTRMKPGKEIEQHIKTYIT